jgi:hypothetical protein
MLMRNVLLMLGGIAALVHVGSYILIMAALDRRGQKTHFLMARWYFGRYLKAYKEATIKESGKPGPLYGICIGAVLLALAFVVAAIAVKRW